MDKPVSNNNKKNYCYYFDAHELIHSITFVQINYLDYFGAFE